MRRSQQGFFLIVAVILIMVLGVMGTIIAYMMVGRARVSPAELQGYRSFYLAESGLDVAIRALISPTAPTPLTCSTLTGASLVTNATLLNGTFTATAVSNALYRGTSILSAAVTATSTTLPLASISGYAAFGRVRIDYEVIDYAAISGTSLIGLNRGANGTTAAAHASGAIVAQNMCLVNVLAGIPTIASPQYHRELQMGVEIPPERDAWLVGSRVGNLFTLGRWNSPTAGQWNDASMTDTTNRENLNGVSFSSSTNGWAVGNEMSNRFTFLRWNGTSWTVSPLSGACSAQELYGVSTISTTQAWAVGARYRPSCANSGVRRYTVLRWNGTAWALVTPTTIPADNTNNQNLNAISMKDTNNDGTADTGFAVGDAGTILRYNGTAFVASTSNTTRDLHGVYTVSATEAWAVGNNGTILKWNGTSWSSVTSPTSNQLNSIYMLDITGSGAATYGVAVGNSGDILIYNGSTWSLQQSTGGNLFGVTVLNICNAWAVGASELIWHWDGITWTAQTSPISGTPDFNAIDIATTPTDPFRFITSCGSTGPWKQIFG